MSFRFCPYCHRGCQVRCYQQHMHDYFCHDVNCPGYHVVSGRRPQKRQEPPIRQPKQENWLLAEDIVTGGRVRYPRYPEDNPVHQHILELGYKSPRPGHRYGYDSHGDVIDFRVSKVARDYVAPRRHRDSGVAKDHRPDDRHGSHRSISHRGRHKKPSRRKEDKPLRPYEIESPRLPPQ
ncbi:hypothetical protein DL770_008292 [Monosporascus sp. CRB-9-2]|nr:hypothetical protein DL770_008292 [Monosporascus sp. CRB-9-2]